MFFPLILIFGEKENVKKKIYNNLGCFVNNLYFKTTLLKSYLTLMALSVKYKLT